jgi:hypothetical protein
MLPEATGWLLAYSNITSDEATRKVLGFLILLFTSSSGTQQAINTFLTTYMNNST